MDGVPSLARYTTPTSKARSTRDEMLENFLAKLNPGRIKAGYKPLTAPHLAKLLKGLDAYKLYRECEEAKSFGALFNYKTKKKP